MTAPDPRNVFNVDRLQSATIARAKRLRFPELWQACPVVEEHDDHDAPDAILDRRDWAEEKMKTHEPRPCAACGLFVMWRPKP